MNFKIKKNSDPLSSFRVIVETDIKNIVFQETHLKILLKIFLSCDLVANQQFQGHTSILPRLHTVPFGKLDGFLR